jgi:hypothetical protein
MPVKKFHSARRIHTWKDGDLVVCSLDNKEIVVVGQVKGVCTKRDDLLDKDTYSGTDAKYNAWEFAIAKYWILPVPVSFAHIATHCGIPLTSKITNNLCKGVVGYAKAFYNGDDSEVVLAKYYSLVQLWLVEDVAPLEDVPGWVEVRKDLAALSSLLSSVQAMHAQLQEKLHALSTK